MKRLEARSPTTSSFSAGERWASGSLGISGPSSSWLRLASLEAFSGSLELLILAVYLKQCCAPGFCREAGRFDDDAGGRYEKDVMYRSGTWWPTEEEAARMIVSDSGESDEAKTERTKVTSVSSNFWMYNA